MAVRSAVRCRTSAAMASSELRVYKPLHAQAVGCWKVQCKLRFARGFTDHQGGIKHTNMATGDLMDAFDGPGALLSAGYSVSAA